MKALASAEGHLLASSGCSTLLAIAKTAAPRMTWFGSSPLGCPMNASNVSWCALHFLWFDLVAKESYMSAKGSSGTLELTLVEVIYGWSLVRLLHCKRSCWAAALVCSHPLKYKDLTLPASLSIMALRQLLTMKRNFV